jgi:hypothetical protein
MSIAINLKKSFNIIADLYDYIRDFCAPDLPVIRNIF